SMPSISRFSAGSLSATYSMFWDDRHRTDVCARSQMRTKQGSQARLGDLSVPTHQRPAAKLQLGGDAGKKGGSWTFTREWFEIYCRRASTARSKHLCECI